MKALLVVDVQNDFLPGGALPVKEGDQIIPFINRLLEFDFPVVVASQDWHPENHGSFAPMHGKAPGDHVDLCGLDQILWPVHCVQNNYGAKFPSNLNSSKIQKVFFKGSNRDVDSYSAFFDNGHLRATGLNNYLKDKSVRDLYIAGLATDYCVKFTTLDALKLGFRVFVISDACRAVNLKEGDGAAAFNEMERAGAKIITMDSL